MNDMPDYAKKHTRLKIILFKLTFEIPKKI